MKNQIPSESQFCGKCPCRAWKMVIHGNFCNRFNEQIAALRPERLPQCLMKKPRIIELEDYDRSEWMERWDRMRKYIAEGGVGSWPRDALESLLDIIERGDE